MAPGFVTDATSGLSMVLTTAMSSNPGCAARANSLLRAKTPCEVASLAAEGAILHPLTMSGSEAPGSPTAVTRECYVAGTGWEASARPRPSTQQACVRDPGKTTPIHVEPLSDWACCINALRAAATVAQGERGLDARLAHLDATWDEDGLFLPLARDPRRRQTSATGVLRDGDVRALRAVASACEDSEAWRMARSGQLVGIRVDGPGRDSGQEILEVIWKAFGRLRPKIGKDGATLEGETAMAAALATVLACAPDELRTCPQCGSPFIAQTRKMTFCCPACRTANHRRASGTR